MWVNALGRLGRGVALALCASLLVFSQAQAQSDLLPSWNDGPAKRPSSTSSQG